jgi:hypothetical protein
MSSLIAPVRAFSLELVKQCSGEIVYILQVVKGVEQGTQTVLYLLLAQGRHMR